MPSPLQEISKRSVVDLVGLAASECAAKTGNTGEALAEVPGV